MHPRLQRALMLIGQSRHELAENELRQVLAQAPDDALAHSILAVCLVQQKKYEEASQEAHQAIHLSPEEPFSFYALSIVDHHRNLYPQAEEAIKRALELNPYRSDFLAHLAQLHFDQERWQRALETAEEGLVLDPEDTSCINLRAMSLVKLGRKMDASDAIETALQRDPEDAYSHANLGWTRLEQGQHEQAMHHFREALRLNPNMEWARAGIVEAMKARYFIYRIMLNWFLWMMKLSGRARWWVIIGAYVGYNVLRRTAAANPALSPYLMPFIVAYIVFAVMTWVASPLFNLTLRLNRFGKLALSDEQIATSNWIGLCIVGAVIGLIAYFVTGNSDLLPGAIYCGLLIPGLAGIYTCDEGWPRQAAVGIVAALFLLGGLSLTLVIAESLVSGSLGRITGNIAGLSLLLFVIGGIISQFAITYLSTQRPRR